MTHKMRGTSTTPVAMVKNQKIDLHPRVSARIPPNKGPKQGPIRTPSWKTLMNFPLSLGSAMSAMQPAPTAMTADPPVAYFVVNNPSSIEERVEMYLKSSKYEQRPISTRREQGQTDIRTHIHDQRPNVDRSSTEAITHRSEDRRCSSLKHEVDSDGQRDVFFGLVEGCRKGRNGWDKDI